MSAEVLVLVKDAEHLARWKAENAAIADLVRPVILDEWTTVPAPWRDGLRVCHVIVPTESGTHPEVSRAYAWASRQTAYYTQERRLALLVDRIRGGDDAG